MTADGITIGRDPTAFWVLPDPLLSRVHARFWLSDAGIRVADLGSSNGTFVDGVRVGRDGTTIGPGCLVRCGTCLLVSSADICSLVPAGCVPDGLGIAGSFHAPGIVARLAEAATIGRHVLLVGESGVGKELAAHAVIRLRAAGRRPGPVIEHNCARSTGADEATSTLFGVGPGVFSDVKPRPGLLEQAAGGVLHLDEVHELPIRVQRSLLRFLEDGSYSRIGETTRRPLDVLVVCATNLDLRQPADASRLAFDLRARLLEIQIPPLAERRADVPAIFRHLLRQTAQRFGLDSRELLLAARTIALEAVCLLDTRGRNVRELIQLCEAVAANVVATRENPAAVLGRLLVQRYPDNPAVRRIVDDAQDAPARPRRRRLRGPTRYERLRNEIIAAYHQNGRNLCAATESLAARGIPVSRRWLSIWLGRWGER